MASKFSLNWYKFLPNIVLLYLVWISICFTADILMCLIKVYCANSDQLSELVITSITPPFWNLNKNSLYWNIYSPRSFRCAVVDLKHDSFIFSKTTNNQKIYILNCFVHTYIKIENYRNGYRAPNIIHFGNVGRIRDLHSNL